MSTTEPTTRPTETKLTRRNMLKSMAAASTAAIVLPAGVSSGEDAPSPEGSTLKQLIENHRRAWQVFEDHCGDEEQVERAYNSKFQRPLVPVTLTSEGKAAAYHEMHFDHIDDTEEQISRAHRELRAKHCSPLAKAMAPDHWQSMADAIERSETRCMEALEKAIEEEEARRAAFGLTEVQHDHQMMSDAEDAAIVEIMRHVPASPSEADEKSAYLRHWFGKGYGFESHHFEAMLQGQAVGSAASGTSPAAADGVLASCFEQWRAEYDLAASVVTDSEANKHCSNMRAIENRMVNVVPTTAQGFAVKLLALTSYGDFELDGPGETLLRDAERICNVHPPRTHKRHLRSR